MKYPALGALALAIALPFTALAQAGKSGSAKKNATRKNPPSESEPTVHITSPQSTLAIPNWLPPTNPIQPAATKLHDVEDTRLDVRFDWTRQWLLGNAVLTVRPHFYPQTQLVLDAKGFDIKSVKLVTGNKEKNLNYQYDKRRLAITLDRAYSRTEPYQVRIQYVAKPDELPAGGSEAITSDKGLYFINPLGTDKNKPRQIWTQGETEANSCWFPTIDRPNQRMTQEISMTVDQPYKTLSNGLLVSSKNNSDGTRTDVWRLSTPHAPYLAMMAVGDFAVITDSWRGKPVNYYVEPKFAGTAKAVFGNTPQMMEFFSKRLGIDFPWEKYSQVAVRDYVSGAMENTTATVHGADVQLTRRELIDENRDDVIAHELFHQWFGDYVTCESWANLPLNESFADYSEYLWAEYKYGRDAAQLLGLRKAGEYFNEAQEKREPLIRYRYADKEDMFDRHSYSKGGRILHMLRSYVGDDAFFTSLNRYLAKNKLTSVELAELRMAFEDVTGEDLNWFFDQWFLQRGHPELAVSHSYADGKVTLRVVQKQDTLYQPVYRMPVTVTTWGNNNQPSEHRITVTKADQTFTLPASQRPALVQFDSEKMLLAELTEEKPQEQWVYQLTHARDYLSKQQAIEALRPKTGDLAVSSALRNGMHDSFWGTRQAAAEAFRRYRGPEGGNVRKELQSMAANDKDSHVRAAALITLSSFTNEDFGDTFTRALADSSYRVVGAAINALTKAPTVAGREQIEKLTSETNATIVTALSNYFALNGTNDHYQWYLRRLDDASDIDLYQLTQNFGTFMLRMPPVERDKGLRKLETLARSHPQYYVRLGAYKGLSTVAEKSTLVRATLQDIRKKEKDERLVGIYNLLQ